MATKAAVKKSPAKRKAAAQAPTKEAAKQTPKPPKVIKAAKVVKPSKAVKPKSADEQKLEMLRSFIRARGAQFLANPQVTSVGIGYKEVQGQKPELAVTFTLNQQAVVQGVGAADPVPEKILVDGVEFPTTKIDRTYKPSYKPVSLEAKDVRKVRSETIAPGMSVGNLFTTAGTIGAFVRDRTTGNLVLLSNWHVLHGPGAALGADIVQPGKHDDNRVDLNRIGTLLRSHLGAAGDCAIATVTSRSVSSKAVDLGVEVTQIGDPEIGDRVIKSGRTTGVTFGKVVRIEVNTKLDYGGGQIATIGGFEIGIDAANPPPDGEVSRGGDSGAAWMAVDSKGKATGTMLGLHFAGDADGTSSEFALACYAKSVMTALEVEPLGAVSVQAASLSDGVVPRSGFDRGFLSFIVPEPTFIPGRRKDLAKLDEGIEIKYCHFSVWLSKARKYPLCVAWNIDGNTFKHLNRASFRVDRRGDLADHQLTDAIYVHNPFDKGHIARRADLCWGTLNEARQANYDSFYFTNIAPQHEAFNQSDNTSDDPEGGVWGRLENTILDFEAPHQLRVSLMGGPVFGPEDRLFKQNNQECLVPDEFWKIVAYTDDDDGQEKVYGFILTQKHLVGSLTIPQGLEFDTWLWARITLLDLEDRTGIVFPKAMKDREIPFPAPQAAGAPQIKLLGGPSDYFA